MTRLHAPLAAVALLTALACSAVAAGPKTTTNGADPQQATVTISHPDGEGRVTVDVGLGPALTMPASGDVVRQWYFQLPGGYRITAVNTFYGIDRGNIQEGLIEVATGLSPPFRLYQRSPHKESNGIYDSWYREEVRYAIAAPTYFTIYCLSRATNGVAGQHVQFGLRLEMEPLL